LKTFAEIAEDFAFNLKTFAEIAEDFALFHKTEQTPISIKSIKSKNLMH